MEEQEIKPPQEQERAAKSDAKRIWISWAVRVGMLLIGILMGWSVTYLSLRPILGIPAVSRSKTATRKLVDSAWTLPRSSAQLAGAGEQVQVAWMVRNVGESTWTPDRYFFAPGTPETPVLALPGHVPPGTLFTLSANLTVPVLPGPWSPTWGLTGSQGPVEGGRLEATIIIQP